MVTLETTCADSPIQTVSDLSYCKALLQVVTAPPLNHLRWSAVLSHMIIFFRKFEVFEALLFLKRVVRECVRLETTKFLFLVLFLPVVWALV